MDNEDNADKLIQARSSTEAKSFVKKLYKSICPCFLPQPYLTNTLGGSSDKDHHYLETTQRVSQKLNSMMSSEDQRSIITGAPNPLYKTVYQHAHRLLQEYDQNLDKSTIKKWHSYSIYEYKQNEIVTIGTSRGRILAKINTVRVDASANAKKLTNKSKRHDRSDSLANSNFDKNWDRRYMLFERFDEGISLDEESWYSVTPQAVAQHIASKIKCDTILDGFCGAGGCSIKFSNTCSRVISNDICLMKLECLKTNAKVYCAENIQMLNENFLNLQSIQPDVVYLAPPYNSQQLLLNNCIDPYQMFPPLNQIFAKAIQLSKNIVILLPPNINVKKLAELIAREYIDSKTPSSTCSIKIEKIFFMSQLRYLTVYLGFIIEKEINLNDELCYVYDYLKEGSKKIFNHKKIIRELREKYGMISLLNFIFDLDKVEQSGTLIEKLYFYIKSNHLIADQRLAKLIKEQNEEVERYSRKKISLVSQVQIMEEQKYMGEDKEETDKERTLSYYSGASVNKMILEDNQTISPQKRQTNFSNAQCKVQDSPDIPRSYTIEFCPTDFFSRSSRQSSEFGEFQSYR